MAASRLPLSRLMPYVNASAPTRVESGQVEDTVEAIGQRVAVDGQSGGGGRYRTVLGKEDLQGRQRISAPGQGSDQARSQVQPRLRIGQTDPRAESDPPMVPGRRCWRFQNRDLTTAQKTADRVVGQVGHENRGGRPLPP